MVARIVLAVVPLRDYAAIGALRHHDGVAWPRLARAHPAGCKSDGVFPGPPGQRGGAPLAKHGAIGRAARSRSAMTTVATWSTSDDGATSRRSETVTVTPLTVSRGSPQATGSDLGFSTVITRISTT